MEEAKREDICEDTIRASIFHAIRQEASRNLTAFNRHLDLLKAGSKRTPDIQGAEGDISSESCKTQIFQIF